MEWKMLLERRRTGVFAADEQTGKPFELETENLLDIGAAAISLAYLFAMLGVFTWQLVDIYSGRMWLLGKICQGGTTTGLNQGTCLVMVYAIIGGGLGGTVNGFRSILVWHAERRAFGWRFVWKYLMLPPLGATLAAFVYALLRAGTDLIGGMAAPSPDITNTTNTAMHLFSAFAIGALSGYGSQQVFKWLDKQVAQLLKTSEMPTSEIPDLTGKTEQAVKDTLRTLKLNLGSISKQPSADPNQVGKVVSQGPAVGTKVTVGSAVDITLASQTP
jgi:hypothetical protein